MLIKKESFREFEYRRALWLEGTNTAEAGEAAKKAPETKEAEKPKVEDQSETIKASRSLALTAIENMAKRYERTGWESTARKLADALKAHAEAKFNTISEQYNKTKEQKGASFETQGQGVVQELNRQAGELLSTIEQRIGKAPWTLQHQARQGAIDTARAEGSGSPEKAKEAEAKIRQIKEGIVLDYLTNAKDTKGMSEPMKKMLARFIVEGNLVELEFADLDAYKDNLDDFFRDADSYSKRIGETLEDKLPAVVKMFLDESPNPEAKQEEISLIKSVISKNPNLLKHYGTESGPDSWQTKVATLLAQQFDIRFKDGKVFYAVDVINNPRLALNATQLENKIINELTKNVNLYDISRTEEYSKTIERGTDWLTKHRAEISEGLTWVAGGGKIDSWDDWQGHQAAENLLGLNADIQRGARTIESRQNREEAAERIKAQQQRMLEAYYKNYETADLADAVKKAVDQGGYRITEDKGKPKPEGPYEGHQILENEAENLRITVALNAEGKITTTIEPRQPNEPGVNYFNSKREYNPQQFKEKASDLAKLAKDTKENWKKNNEKVSRVNQIIGKVDIANLKIDFSYGQSAERYEADFKPMSPVLRYKGHEVGTLIIPMDRPDTEADNIQIQIKGEKEPRNCRADGLQNTLKTLVQTFEKTAKQGDKTKEEIKKKTEADIPGDYNPGEGLTFRKEQDITGDFTSTATENKVRVGTFNKTDLTEAATLYMRTNAASNNYREYVLVVGGEEKTFITFEEVKTHITTNRADLARVPEKQPEPVTVPVENQKAFDNLKTSVLNLWGPEKGLKENDIRFNNALIVFLKDLPADRKTALEASDAEKNFQLTDQEKRSLSQTLAQSYGVQNLEAVDPTEVKLIGNIPVTIKGESTTLSAAFGDDLAKTLSMRHEFRAAQGGGAEVKEGADYIKVDENNIQNYLPASLQEGYKAVRNGEDGEALAKFKEAAGDEAKAAEAMQALGEIMNNPNKVEAFKKMGLGELIGSLAQLWKMFQEAFKTGDWQSLQDGLKDFQAGINPIDRIESSKKQYAEKINGIQDTGELLALYNEPYGEKANALFAVAGEKGTTQIPYRIQAKEIIRQRFADDLGVEIIDMTKSAGNKTVIDCYKGENKYRITLERDGTRTLATMDELKRTPEPDSREVAENRVKKTQILNINTGNDNLAAVLFNATSVSSEAGETAGEGGETQEEAVDKKESPKGVKPEFGDVQLDGTIKLKGVADKKIHEILESNVTEVTVRRANGGAEVTATKQDGTYEVDDQRLKIYDGDIITETKT